MSARITEAMRDAAANILAQADGCQYVFAKHYDLANMVLAAALSTEPGEAEGWRDISSAPKDGAWLFLHVPGHGPARARWRTRMGWESHNSGREITRATHWRPMFESPVQP